MPDESQTIELDDPASLRTQARQWRAERIGWLAVAATLLAALAGLLGPGLLSFRTRESSDGRLSVEYYWAQRFEAPAELFIRLQPAASESKVRLAISRS